MAVVPGSEGDLGVLKDHAPLISTLKPGVVELYDTADGAAPTESFFVVGGFVEIAGAHCNVLAPEALPLADVTPALATERLQAAQKQLKKAESDAEKQVAEEAIALAKQMQEVAAAA